MKQLALTLAPPPEPSLDNFYPGRNAELVTALRGLADGISAERFFYLWGEPGCGPTAISLFRDAQFIVLCHLSGRLVHLDAAPIVADGYPVRPPPCVIPPQAGLVIREVSPDSSRILREESGLEEQRCTFPTDTSAPRPTW